MPSITLLFRGKDETSNVLVGVTERLNSFGKIAITAVGGFAASSVKASTEFNAAMSETAAVADANTEQLDRMKQKALELGAKYPVSAKDAANAMGELAKAGFNAEQTIKGSAGVVQLASATHYTMADSATILANAITGFKLKAEDANMVTDLLAKTANASAVDVKDLGESFKYAAPAAAAANFSIQDTSFALGMMGNAGIKASSAGTGLKAVITNLVSPSDKAAGAFKQLGYSITDSEGKVKPLRQQLSELRDKFSTLSEADKIDLAQKIVGKDHFTKLLAIVNSSKDSFDQMSDAIDHSKDAGADMAKVMNDNVAGAMENFKGSLETIQIKLGNAFQPAIKVTLNMLSDLLNALNPLVDWLSNKIANAFTVAGRTAGELGTALKPLWGALQNLYNAFQPKKADDLGTSLQEAARKVEPFKGIIDKIADVVSHVFVPAINELASIVPALKEKFGSLIGQAWNLYQAFSPLGTAIDVLKGFFAGGINGAIDALGDRVVGMGNVFGINLLPVVQNVVNFVENQLIPTLGNIANFIFTQVLPSVQQFAQYLITDVIPNLIQIGSTIISNVMPVLGSIGDFIMTTVLPALQQFGQWILTNLGPIFISAANTIQTSIIPGLQSLGNFIVTTVLPKLMDLGNWIGQVIVPVLEKMAAFIANPVIPVIGQIANVIMTTVIPVLTQWWSILATVVAPIIQRIADIITGVVIPALTGLISFISGTVIPIFQAMGSFISTYIMPILQGLASFISGALTAVFNAINATISFVWSSITSTISGAWSVIAGIGNAMMDFLNGGFTNAWNSILQTISNVWNGIVGAIRDAWNTVLQTLNFIYNFLYGVFTSVWNDLRVTVATTWNNIVGAVSNAKDRVISLAGDILTFFKELPGKIWDALSSLPGKMLDAGGAAIKGFISGFSNIHIPTPHVNVSWGSAGVGPISVPVPSFDIQWFAKGGLFNAPSIIGVGEAGPEAVLPINQIGPLLKNALVDAFNSGGNSGSSGNLGGGGNNITNNFYLTANYAYQSENSVMQDLKMLQMLGSRT